jgi:hypothetical protein
MRCIRNIKQNRKENKKRERGTLKKNRKIQIDLTILKEDLSLIMKDFL